MLHLLGPAQVRDVDQTVNTLLELNEDTEVGEVANLSGVLAANRILGLDGLLRNLLQLLDTQAHLALLAVESQDDCLNLVANVQELLC